MTTISSYGMILQSNSGLLKQQGSLALLNEQLSSGKKNSSLTGYDTVSVGRLLSFQNSITEKNSYLDSIATLGNRLDLYDDTMGELSDIAAQANTLSTQNQSYDASKLASLSAQADNYLRQITENLNVKFGDRYLYAGLRYGTAPVIDIAALSTSPTTTITANPALPEYDADYASTTNANAFVADQATINPGYQLTYGITSTDASFQRLIAGVRYIKEAANSATAAAYQSNMQQAAALLGTAVTGLQTIHAQVANNQNVIEGIKESLTSEISSLKGQVDDIQQVDVTEVSVAINLMQTQMQASYSATGKLIQLSILNYL